MALELISQYDIDQLDQHIDTITKNAKSRIINLVEPYEQDIIAINEIIINYIKKYRRKIYGGYALNLLLINKDPSIALYDNSDIPDIDFYSPDPINDLINICNLIHKKGYKYVTGREAIHKETYSVRVNNQLYCDISYVPRNIYNHMPFREINGLCVTGPEFMMIDYYRILTDIISMWRIQKSIKRFYLLQKYYPLPYVKNELYIPDIAPDTQKFLDIIFGFIQNRESVVVVGLYAYNHYLKFSGLLKYKYVNIPFYEIISTNYKNDAIELINLLKSINSDNIHVIENYPFFMYLGYSVDIYYKDLLIAKIYNYNKRCIPFVSVSAEKFNNIITPSKNTINIGTHALVILYSLIMINKARITQDRQIKDLYYTLISNITDMRNYYFNKYKKTIYDNTIFGEFIMECKGIPITPERERQLIIESRKKRNKKYIFSYDPNETTPEEINYIFSNSSGNPIRNIKNLQLVDDVKDEYDEIHDDQVE